MSIHKPKTLKPKPQTLLPPTTPSPQCAHALLVVELHTARQCAHAQLGCSPTNPHCGASYRQPTHQGLGVGELCGIGQWGNCVGQLATGQAVQGHSAIGNGGILCGRLLGGPAHSAAVCCVEMVELWGTGNVWGVGKWGIVWGQLATGQGRQGHSAMGNGEQVHTAGGVVCRPQPQTRPCLPYLNPSSPS